MRHLREVGHDVATLDVLTDTHDHRVVIVAGRLAAQHVTEADKFLVGVRDLDTDGLLARDGRQDAHVGAGHGVGDVLAQTRDAVNFDAGAELDLVTRDRRAAGETGDDGVDAELVEHLGERVDDAVVRGRTLLGRRALLEEGRLGQRVRDVAGEGELLDALWELLRRLSLDLTLRHLGGRALRRLMAGCGGLGRFARTLLGATGRLDGGGVGLVRGGRA